MVVDPRHCLTVAEVVGDEHHDAPFNTLARPSPTIGHRALTPARGAWSWHESRIPFLLRSTRMCRR